jgi:hypothetical protein
MAGIKISALPAVPSAATTDIFPVVQGGVTYKETLAQVQTAFGFTGGILQMSAGGTAANLAADNGAIVYSTASALALLAHTATANQVVLSGAASAPSFSTATYPVTTTINQLLFSTSNNVIGALTAANSASLVSTSAGVPIWSSSMTNGQVILGSTGATPVAATIGSSGNISLTTGAGTLSIGTSGFASFVWNDLPGTSVTASGNNGYIISNAGQSTVTIAATVTEGSIIAIAGKGAAGWILQANAGQTIHFGSSATSVAGSLTSTNQWDCVEVICVTANTTFTVKSAVGNLTVA